MKKLLYLLIVCSSNLSFGQNPVEAPNALPEIRIITENEIRGNRKVQAEIKISDYPRAEHWGYCGIELRGNSTLLAKKKSYDFEFRTILGEEVATSIFGFPYEEDFVLLANSYDKSFVRNALAFEMWDVLGHYTPRYVYCNLYINDQFQGLYMLAEKVKVDPNRIRVADETKGSEIPINSGFLIKMDWDAYESNFGYDHQSIGQDPLHFDFVFPKAKKLNYSARLDARVQLKIMAPLFEDLLLDSIDRLHPHYSEFIDMNSFADYFLVNELCKNPDGLKTSMYLHQLSSYKSDSIPPKISMGPIWDMDLGLANVDYSNCSDPEGWAFYENGPLSNIERLPNWWHCLVYDPVFIEVCQKRLALLMDRFSMETGGDLIDRLYVQLKGPIEKDSERWQDSKDERFRVAGPIKTTMDEEFFKIRTFYSKRIEWMEANLGKIEKVHPDVAYFQSLNLIRVKADTVNREFEIQVHASKTRDMMKSQWDAPPIQMDYDNFIVKNLQGEIVLEGQASEKFKIPYEGWAKGEYFLEVTMLDLPQLMTSGGYGSVPIITFSGGNPMLIYGYTSTDLLPTLSAVPFNGLSAAPALNSYPFKQREKLKFRLVVP